MELNPIYDYIAELSRCEYPENALTYGVMYNGIEIARGTAYYCDMLSRMHESAERILLSLMADGRRSVVQGIYVKVCEINERHYDVITEDAVQLLISDTVGATTPAIEADIALGNYVIMMHGTQRSYRQKLLRFIRTLLSDSFSLDSAEVTTELDNRQAVIPVEEWIDYEELIRMFNFRGVKSAKDPKWRKRTGFDKCVSQTGAGCAVKFSVSKVHQWLENGKVPRK